MHSILAALVMLSLPAAEPEADRPFAQRGCYITFMKFGRPDLSVHGVPQEYHESVMTSSSASSSSRRSGGALPRARKSGR